MLMGCFYDKDQGGLISNSLIESKWNALSQLKQVCDI